MGAAKSYPTPLSDQDGYLVEFDGPDDKLHPQNWVVAENVVVSLVLSFVTFTATFASSIFSPAIPAVVEQFRVSNIVGVLTISLYVLGFATGPILWSPMSEVYGRKIPLLISSLGYPIFQLPVAVAHDLQTIMICRFFRGFFGACPLVVVGAVFADMFDDGDIGLAVTALSASVFTGPLLAPIIGGFIAINSSLGLALDALSNCYPRVYRVFTFGVASGRDVPTDHTSRKGGISPSKDEELIHTRQTGRSRDRVPRSAGEEPYSAGTHAVHRTYRTHAFHIHGLIYGLLYLFLSFYPIVFQGVPGMNSGVGALPYLGMLAGEILAGLYIAADSPRYNRNLAENHGIVVP